MQSSHDALHELSLPQMESLAAATGATSGVSGSSSSMHGGANATSTSVVPSGETGATDLPTGAASNLLGLDTLGLNAPTLVDSLVSVNGNAPHQAVDPSQLTGTSTSPLPAALAPNKPLGNVPNLGGVDAAAQNAVITAQYNVSMMQANVNAAAAAVAYQQARELIEIQREQAVAQAMLLMNNNSTTGEGGVTIEVLPQEGDNSQLAVSAQEQISSDHMLMGAPRMSHDLPTPVATPAPSPAPPVGGGGRHKRMSVVSVAGEDDGSTSTANKRRRRQSTAAGDANNGVAPNTPANGSLEAKLMAMSKDELIREILVLRKSQLAEETPAVTQCKWDNCLLSDHVFDSTEALADHVFQAHVMERPYVCRWEGCTRGEARPFQKRNKLLEHVRSHTDEKPYVCPVEGCFKRFGRTFVLERHIRTHNAQSAELKHASPQLACPVPGCRILMDSHESVWQHLATAHSCVFPAVTHYQPPPIQHPGFGAPPLVGSSRPTSAGSSAPPPPPPAFMQQQPAHTQQQQSGQFGI